MNCSCLICLKPMDRGGNMACTGLELFGVCPSCLADARLGRLVRQIPIGGMVRRGDSSICGFQQGKEWLVMRVFGLPEYGETLESAMIKAGIEGDK